MDGGCGRMNRACGHVLSARFLQYLPVVVLPFPRFTRLKNFSIARGAGPVGFPSPSAFRGSYRLYRLVPGAFDAVVSSFEELFRYQSVPRTGR